jgi:hypothetical protein
MWMTLRYGCSVKSSCFGAWGDYGGMDLGDAKAEVVELALPDGAGMRGWVDAGRARCCKVVVGGGGMCARRLSGYRLAVLWTSCPWWPSFLDNLLLGAHSPRHETGNRICAAAASVLGLSLWCHYRSLEGIFLTVSSFSSWVLIGYVVHLLLTAAIPSGVWLRRPGSGSAGLKGKCAFGPFLSILVIKCKHKCLNVKICPWMNKVQITSQGMFLSLSTLVLYTNILSKC